jgi:hypothetical protein
LFLVQNLHLVLTFVRELRLGRWVAPKLAPFDLLAKRCIHNRVNVFHALGFHSLIDEGTI